MTKAIRQIADRHFGAKTARALAAKGITLVSLQAVPGFPGDQYFSGTGYVLDNNGECQVLSLLEVLDMVKETVQIIPNPFHNNGKFVAQIITGKYAGRGYIADGHSAHRLFDTAEEAASAAKALGYLVAGF